MSALPERYQRYAQPGQQPVQPIAVYQPQPVEVYEERPPVAYVADLDNPGRSVAIDARLIQRPEPAPPRDLAPQPLIDPHAQAIFAKGAGTGVAAAGIGWGVGQAAAGVAAIGGTSAVVAMLALWLLSRLGGGRVVNHIRNEQHTHVHQKWLGRTNIRNEQ